MNLCDRMYNKGVNYFAEVLLRCFASRREEGLREFVVEDFGFSSEEELYAYARNIVALADERMMSRGRDVEVSYYCVLDRIVGRISKYVYSFCYVYNGRDWSISRRDSVGINISLQEASLSVPGGVRGFFAKLMRGSREVRAGFSDLPEMSISYMFSVDYEFGNFDDGRQRQSIELYPNVGVSANEGELYYVSSDKVTQVCDYLDRNGVVSLVSRVALALCSAPVLRYFEIRGIILHCSTRRLSFRLVCGDGVVGSLADVVNSMRSEKYAPLIPLDYSNGSLNPYKYSLRVLNKFSDFITAHVYDRFLPRVGKYDVGNVSVLFSWNKGTKLSLTPLHITFKVE